MEEEKATVATQGTQSPTAIKGVLCVVLLFFVLSLAAAVGVSVYFLRYQVGDLSDGATEDGAATGAIGANREYELDWTSDSETLTVTIVGRTRGWVGFGVSGTGGMKNADMLVAWVDDMGAGHVLDTHADNNGAPIVDTLSQDWELLEASEDGESTKVVARRFLRLCDPGNRNITSGTLKVIWALGASDPASETSLGGADYHGSQRGTMAHRLLDGPSPPQTLPENAISYDIFQENVNIPSDRDTTYWCRVVPLPDRDRKLHFIMTEPVIQDGNELFVHHILVYTCSGIESAAESVFADGGYHCGGSGVQSYCDQLLTAWAVGGTDQYLPEHVGFPVDPDFPQYLLIGKQCFSPINTPMTSVVDSSGLRMWLTPDLRQYDASILWTGMLVDWLQIIPGGVDHFVTTGHCAEDCLNTALEGHDDGVRIFAGFLHTHLAGVSVKLRHIRNGTELPPILEDNSYDFNYQNMISLDEEVIVRAGDRLMVECGYTTTGRQNITYGGLGTYDEMCLSFLYVYPQLSVLTCVTVPSIPQLVKAIPGSEIRYEGGTYYFTAPDYLNGFPVDYVLNYLLNNVEDAAEALQAVNQDGGVYSFCQMRDSDSQFKEMDIPPVEAAYIEAEEEECHFGTDGFPEG